VSNFLTNDKIFNTTEKRLTEFFGMIGGLGSFSIRFFKEVFRPPYEIEQIRKHMIELGMKTLPIVGVTGFIIGLVIAMQLSPVLKRFGAEAFLPGSVGISIVRELGPVICALIFAGRVSSGIGAELGSMRVTEQIDAMEVSGTNPFKYLVITRIIATTVMLPLLVIVADAVAIYGAFIGVNLKGDVSFPLFILQVFEQLTFMDVIPAIIKTFFFGFAIGIIGCFKGFNSKNGTEGVGISANSAVVLGSLAVFVIDLIAVQITSIFQ